MAIQKLIKLPNGTEGDHIVLGNHGFSKFARYCRAEFLLFASAKAREDAPDHNMGVVATMHLEGAQFDKYLAPELINEHGLPDQLYKALMGGERSLPGLGITRDDWMQKVKIGTGKQA